MPHLWVHLCLCRSGRRSDCWSSYRRFARLCADHPCCVVHCSRREEAQIRSGKSSRGHRDEVSLQSLSVVAFHHVISNLSG